MSELDDLEEIADATAFGPRNVTRLRSVSHRHFAETCGGGHPWTEETTRWYHQGGRPRRICRICDKERKRKLMQCSSIAPGIARAGAEQ